MVTRKNVLSQIIFLRPVFKLLLLFKLSLTEQFFFENYGQLERVNKDLFAMSVCTVDGQRFHLGLVSNWPHIERVHTISICKNH